MHQQTLPMGQRKKQKNSTKLADAKYTSALNRTQCSSFDPRCRRHQSKKVSKEEINNLLPNRGCNRSGGRTYWEEIPNSSYQAFDITPDEEATLKINCGKFSENSRELGNSQAQD